MGGGGIPYNLRINKAVERQTFTDLLCRINEYHSISTYSYISFGGPYLEDFKIMHNLFNMQDLVSIEGNPYVYKRQIFNKPNTYIKLVNDISTSFIERTSFEKETIFWLDFTSVEQLGEQLYDFFLAIQKTPLNSIIKITLNAHVSSLLSKEKLAPLLDENNNVVNEKQHQQTQRLFLERCEKYKQMVDSGFHVNDFILPEYMTANKYPDLLFETLKRIAFKALEGTNQIFFPLSGFTYQDGQKMLTFTGIKIEDEKIDTFVEQTKIKEWEYYCLDDKFIDINVPFLTFGEKIFIDKHTPAYHRILENDYCFELGEKADETKLFLENYKKFYRFYPNFSKVIF